MRYRLLDHRDDFRTSLLRTTTRLLQRSLDELLARAFLLRLMRYHLATQNRPHDVVPA